MTVYPRNCRLLRYNKYKAERSEIISKPILTERSRA